MTILPMVWIIACVFIRTSHFSPAERKETTDAKIWRLIVP